MMNGIDLMVKEHNSIKRMLAVIRKACYGILQGKQIDYDDFHTMIDFIRNFADAHHHGKEEKILFARMVEEIGGPAEKLVKHGMLVEHDLGRLYMKELEEALDRVKGGDDESKVDVIANAVGYTHLLSRHIDKEDTVAYSFARRALSKTTLESIDEECLHFEKAVESKGIQEKYLSLIEKLEHKYITI